MSDSAAGARQARLGELAARLGGTLAGDPEAIITDVERVEHAVAGHIAVAWTRAAIRALPESRASAFVTAPGVELPGRPVIHVPHPRLAFAALIEYFHPDPPARAGIEPGALVSPQACCAPDVYVAAGARVERGAVLGAGAQVHANAFIGENVRVGDQAAIFPNAVVHAGVTIGRRVIVGSGAVIGGAGFGFERSPDGRLRHIPQAGVVELEDDVEIGALTNVDRATLGRTIVGRGTKIDSQVQVAHNVELGEGCCIAAQTGIAGGARIGGGTVIGGQAGIADNVRVAAGSRIAAQAGVAYDLERGSWAGAPAQLVHQAGRLVALLKRLPEMYDELRELRARCGALEAEVARLRDRDPKPEEAEP
ncbi:MAG: UDP-3-O-(3-hydroxymyristoyl)glucosamine N-acyltransferase [Candidatus Schekmanbacteria bacterium]|nr:UDP-3-O-(3-hydroxymyristoyl)glucosamine N-acyltransferase [Candidatus Schekmanbacteria bacterium]